MPEHDTKPFDQKAYLRQYYLDHAEHIKAHNRARYKRLMKENPEKLASCSTWSKKNPEKRRLANKLWVQKNPEKFRAYKRKWRKKQRPLRTPAQVINDRLSTAIGNSLRGREEKAGRRWQTLVGYTTEQLKIHLESRFTKGMTWAHFIRGEIHIDHKIPRASFTFLSASDICFKQCWSLENLQPLWKRDNIAKSDRITQPTQIPLGI